MPDIRDLLRGAAPRPGSGPDLAAIESRVTRRRRLRQGAVAASLAGLVAAVVAAVSLSGSPFSEQVKEGGHPSNPGPPPTVPAPHTTGPRPATNWPSAPTTAPGGTAPPPTTAATVTTTTPTTAAPTGTAPTTPTTAAPATSAPSSPAPAVAALLQRLQTVPFNSSMPQWLHAGAVGPLDIMDVGHAGHGYVGAAKVDISSTLAGENVQGANYWVYSSVADANAWFASQKASWSTYRGISELQLTPPTAAFCGLATGRPDPVQGGGATYTCWLTRGTVAGDLLITVPVGYGGDETAVMQAMLSHLIAVGG